MNPEAKELNKIIKNNNNIIYELLSSKGKNIFFPKKGIVSQSSEAKNKKFNATVGIALQDNSNPMFLKSIKKKIKLNSKEIFTYSPSSGEIDLRKKWLELIKLKNPSLKNKTTLPVITNALTHALNVLSYMFINKGDEIILPNLYWGNYNLLFKNLFGAKIKTFELFNNNDNFNLKSFKEIIKNSSRKKIILLNFPNNPTGYTPTKKEFEEISKIIKNSAKEGNKIIVICDDAYFGLVYKKNISKESIFSNLANLHKNILAIKVDGISKEDYSWGLRIGFLTFSYKGMNEGSARSLELKASGIIRASISNSSHLSQSLILSALNSKNYLKEKKEKYKILKERFVEVEKILKNKKFEKVFKILPHNSGYFLCIKLKNNINEEKLRKLLLEKYNTGIISMNSVIRIAFSSISKRNIKILFENIYNALIELNKKN